MRLLKGILTLSHPTSMHLRTPSTDPIASEASQPKKTRQLTTASGVSIDTKVSIITVQLDMLLELFEITRGDRILKGEWSVACVVLDRHSH